MDDATRACWEVNGCGLGRLRQPSLAKASIAHSMQAKWCHFVAQQVGNWLTQLSRRLGSLEEYQRAGIASFTVSLLRRSLWIWSGRQT